MLAGLLAISTSAAMAQTGTTSDPATATAPGTPANTPPVPSTPAQVPVTPPLTTPAPVAPAPSAAAPASPSGPGLAFGASPDYYHSTGKSLPRAPGFCESAASLAPHDAIGGRTASRSPAGRTVGRLADWTASRCTTGELALRAGVASKAGGRRRLRTASFRSERTGGRGAKADFRSRPAGHRTECTANLWPQRTRSGFTAQHAKRICDENRGG